MGMTEDIRDRLELDKYEAMLQLRKAELENEIKDIRESLGETLDDAVEEVHGFVDKIKANIKPILIGVALFFTGIFVGSLSSIL
ncbi:hypothetical protein KAR91_38335 [Candidatus Pacearchaeota archaeon]|nr:hypothetical protein [Candidatus Pacearchaeota archaeon]